MIEIGTPGLLTSIQDRGRVGYASLGVGRSGAADRMSHDLANRLVGNDPLRAALETTGGLSFTVLSPIVVALTGAWCAPQVRGGPPLGFGAPQALPAGAAVRLGPATHGWRCSIAIRGGIDTPVVLGSRSWNAAHAIGTPVETGSVLAIGADPGVPLVADLAPQRAPSTDVRVEPGPRRDWFDDDAWALLLRQPYVVQPASNRVGARLRGASPLVRRNLGELPSEGLIEGAVQVPPDGQPIVMLADHPVTGGYPVIAVVRVTSLGSVAQAAPGMSLRFRP